MGPLKTFKAGLLGFLGTLAFFGSGTEAKAYDNDYCREYTRTVYIGGRSEDAYGRACLQPNGDWMIVDEDLGYNDVPDNVTNVNYVIRDNNRTYVPQRVVYYSQPHVNYYRSRPVQPQYVWYNGGHYNHGRHVVYKKKPVFYKQKQAYRHDHDRHDHRGRGHGRDRGHDRD